ncbi:hypothetical protein C5Y93_15040 [Blastopirellula marina]|uniref:Uncharacterized protein n=2 Tax=Blastopirellula marina TaxID=124 RepID=A0A2S8GLS1_9BACT|nr:hypothetical protein C5Y93_15040 [Blastopirellula marina]
MGCSWRPTEDKHALADSTFGERHTGHYPANSVLALASEVTQIEDEIRRNGSITVKAPDVWGNADLMSGIQEYEEVMKGTVGDFDQVLSAYIARSDQMELQSATSVGAALSDGAPAAAAPSMTMMMANMSEEGSGADTAPATPEPTAGSPPEVGEGKGSNITNITSGGLFANFSAVTPNKNAGVGVEPTELLRQESTYIGVNQSLRRINMGDDRSRQAGYALYKFRVPVSVLPGRQTHRGYAAVVNMRARLHIDAAHLKYTFPKLVVADVVDSMEEPIFSEWDRIVRDAAANKSKPNEEERAYSYNLKPSANSMLQKSSANQNPLPTDYGDDTIRALAEYVVEEFDNVRPKRAELRAFLFQDMSGRYEVLRRQKMFTEFNSGDDNPYLISAAAENLAMGCEPKTQRHAWLEAADKKCNESKEIDWIVALQAGVLDHNIKRMVEELALQGKMSAADAELAKSVFFFEDPVSDQDETVRLWDTIIQEAFPVHVFALDPVIEEQNAYDAFSRRREMQVALAISVAKGRFNTQQKVDMSRQLALDMAAIDLNRTTVAFGHDNDTFGWYFYPRIQSPPTEKSNIAATARLLWSGGPTEHYDRKHLEIEPGMRECEVLIAMPSFVPHVDFDVTTNWERLTNPGATKRSYEEMLKLGSRVHQLRCNLREACDQQCFRPGDYSRLISRVDQLEKMLALQTYEVDVPFEYEQSGTRLFDQGNAQLRPELFDFYGLNHVTTDEKEGVNTYFFLRGRNFHAINTHVIIGGAKSDASTPVGNPDIEVISRELIRVKVNRLYPLLSSGGKFEVRCATPAGISNPVTIEGQSKAPAATPDFSLDDASLLGGTAEFTVGNVFNVHFASDLTTTAKLMIRNNQSLPLPQAKVFQVVTEWSFNTKEKSKPTVSATTKAVYDAKANVLYVDLIELQRAAFLAIEAGARQHRGDFTEITGTVKLRIGNWPFQSVGGSAKIKQLAPVSIPTIDVTPTDSQSSAAEAETTEPGTAEQPMPEAIPMPSSSDQGAIRLHHSESVANRLRL